MSQIDGNGCKFRHSPSGDPFLLEIQCEDQAGEVELLSHINGSKAQHMEYSIDLSEWKVNDVQAFTILLTMLIPNTKGWCFPQLHQSIYGVLSSTSFYEGICTTRRNPEDNCMS